MTKRILVIDDSASMRQLLAATLLDAGYAVVEAADGRDALAQLSAQRIHLAVCDVNMPVMDGLSFVKEVRKHADFRFLPIIMLTTESSEDRKEEGQIAGARAWVVKPFRPEQILRAVEKLILA